jgi:hypothetical protein
MYLTGYYKGGGRKIRREGEGGKKIIQNWETYV